MENKTKSKMSLSEQIKHKQKIKDLNANYFEKMKKQDKDHNNQITLYEINLLVAISRLKPDQSLKGLLIGVATERNIDMEVLKLTLTQLIKKEYITLTSNIKNEEDPDFKLTKSGKALVKRINKKGE